MKCKTMRHGIVGSHWILMVVLALCYIGCKDDETNESFSYDPNKPVEITGFTPEEGTGNATIVIYGKNFGTDVSAMKLKIGGKDAIVVNSLGNSMFAIVPEDKNDGTMELTVGAGEQAQTVVAEKKFIYTEGASVATLCGGKDEDGKFEVKEGPFNDCGGFDNPSWLSFDPAHKNILYMLQDEGAQRPLRIIDLETEYVYTAPIRMDRPRTITWAQIRDPQTGELIPNAIDTMIIACDRTADNHANHWYLPRMKDKELPKQFEDGGNRKKRLAEGRGCNGSAIHPQNGALYYTSFARGEVFRYDYRLGLAREDAKFFPEYRKRLFTIQDNNWEINIVIHPTGRYAYLVVINQHYILRTDYDPNKQEFTDPYLFCGAVGQGSWVDGAGTNARLGRPYQGVFVKNKDYAGQTDEYDFYFTEADNHCIRKLTPFGVVSTFAGRGSTSLNGEAKGYIDGPIREKARFQTPRGLAYDEESKTFYIGDVSNKCIRTIVMKEWQDTDVKNEKIM